MNKGLLSFFSYFLPEKVLAVAVGIFVLVNVSFRYPPGVLTYGLLPLSAAVVFYWALALFTRNRRARVRAQIEQRELAQWFSGLGLDGIDAMSGYEFEEYAVLLLERNGYSVLEHLGGAGDQGVDIIAEKDDVRYAIQCKCYAHNLDNTPVQEVCAGRNYYHCHVGAVLANGEFTPSAVKLAECNNILLWGREKLITLIAKAEEATSG